MKNPNTSTRLGPAFNQHGIWFVRLEAAEEQIKCKFSEVILSYIHIVQSVGFIPPAADWQSISLKEKIIRSLTTEGTMLSNLLISLRLSITAHCCSLCICDISTARTDTGGSGSLEALMKVITIKLPSALIMGVKEQLLTLHLSYRQKGNCRRFSCEQSPFVSSRLGNILLLCPLSSNLWYVTARASAADALRCVCVDMMKYGQCESLSK